MTGWGLDSCLRGVQTLRQRLVGKTGRNALGSVLTHSPLAGPAIDREHGPALAVLVTDVDEHPVAIVFYPYTGIWVTDLMQGLGPIAVGDEA